MSSSDLAGCKKRKRGERVFKFKSFCEQGYPVALDGALRHNVETLVTFGHVERSSSSSSFTGNQVQSWSFQLQVHGHPPFHILLFVIEEPVEASLSRHCKHCQYVGWGQHFICKKKYHFLVPSKETMASCEEHGEEGKSNILELEGHTMHGVFHSNGFGHLLCVNGLESGSNLSGHQIMDFWDRLCTGLRARGVSVYDISRKRGMDLRLLHGVAYGVPWFGRWGYKFGRGSYNVSQQMYHTAIEALQSMPLTLLITHLGSFNQELPLIFSRYQSLSDHALMTLVDLLRFMLDFKAQLPADSLRHKLLLDISASRWSPKRVEMAIRVVVEALKRAEFKWVSRQEVRDAARVYIGDTGLLDFVLKSLGNRIVGNFLVRRCLNPLTKVLEYCLEDVSNMFPTQENMVMNKVNAKYKATRIQLNKDIFYMYKHILKEQKAVMNAGFFTAIPMASQIIRDTKYFVKDYSGDQPSLPGDSLMVYCTVMIKEQMGEYDELYKRVPPYESLAVKKTATVEQLKLQVEKTFSDIYLDLRSFSVQSVAQSDAVDKNTVQELAEKSGSEIVFEGSDENEGKRSGERKVYESGFIVDCNCGTKDDDGERMVSCDICEVWQHTRCARIPNSEQVPSIFLCSKCEHDITLLPSLP
uniref:Zinc finger PHD-type domain-containing protein n=2 Tax=Kalanchoe fedtschenkoi TaxID=63787 RepID=A0A7N0V9P5_KALFE